MEPRTNSGFLHERPDDLVIILQIEILTRRSGILPRIVVAGLDKSRQDAAPTESGYRI